jgi:hypothetical protein
MVGLRGFRFRRSITALGVLALPGAAACLLWLALAAMAQDAAPRVQPHDPPPAVQPHDSSYKPGFFAAFGRWLDEGRAKFKANMESAQENVGKLGGQMRDAAKDATGAIATLPNTTVINGRERCASAPNGAPDCKMTAETICKGRGFQSGKSLATVSEEKCPARIFLEARAPHPGECRQETYLTRVVCQ